MAAPAVVASPAVAQCVAYDTLRTLALRVGLIRSAWREPQAKRQMYRLQIDLGPLGLRNLTSVITGLGPDEPGRVEAQLVGKRVIVACQIAPRMILEEVSEGVLLSGYLDPQQRLGSLPIFVSEGLPLGSPIQ